MQIKKNNALAQGPSLRADQNKK